LSCNLAKSDRTTGFDPDTGKLTELFNPRVHRWDEHFQWADDEQTLIGLTAVGRATVDALDMNNDMRLEARRLWFDSGWLP
jgi:hypothetical protein